MDVVNALKQISLFHDLPDAAIRGLASVAETHMAEKGEVIVHEGRPSDALYVLHSGTVHVSKQAGGESTDLVMLGSHSWFGEVGLLDDAPRSASVTANERSELLILKVAKLKAKIDADHELGYHFYRALARSLSRRLRQTSDDLGFARQLAKERSGR
jgi:CRP/FNR family cyclic AMP-dependent transcriptional regulator